MRARSPSLAMGPPLPPRTSISVVRDGEQLQIGFNGQSGGHIEVVSVADAEALAERLLDWIEVVRFDQFAGKPLQSTTLE